MSSMLKVGSSAVEGVDMARMLGWCKARAAKGFRLSMRCSTLQASSTHQLCKDGFQALGWAGTWAQHTLQHTLSQQHASVVQGRLSGLELGRDLGSAYAAARSASSTHQLCRSGFLAPAGLRPAAL